MTQTTTSENACNVGLWIDNGSGVITNVSGSTNQAGIDMTTQTGETYTFQGQWAIKKGCKTSAKISVQALYSLTADEGLDILRDWYFNSPGVSRTVRVDIPDSNVASDRYSGEFILESLSIPLSADDAGVILASASLSNDGAFAHSVIAS